MRRLFGLFGKKGEEAAEPPARTEPKCEREFPRIPQAELRRHVGRHVALVEGRIVASADTARAALRAARQNHPGEEIDLRYVGSERLLIPCRCLDKKGPQ